MSALRAPVSVRLLPLRALRSGGRILRRVPPITWAAVIALLVGLGGGWLWLRDSSLVAVRQVDVVGASGPQAAAVRRALDRAARDQTTLHVRVGALRAAVSSFPLVRSLEVRTHLPHRLTIVVEAERPVAAVVVAGRPTGINAEGKVLPGGLGGAAVPDVHMGTPPAGARVTDPAMLAGVSAAATAPPALRARLGRISLTRRGLTVTVRRGPVLYLGSAGRLDAKWMAVLRVLDDPSSHGASYLDVRVPERPAAGGVAPPPPQPTATTTTPTTTSAAPAPVPATP